MFIALIVTAFAFTGLCLTSCAMYTAMCFDGCRKILTFCQQAMEEQIVDLLLASCTASADGTLTWNTHPMDSLHHFMLVILKYDDEESSRHLCD